MSDPITLTDLVNDAAYLSLEYQLRLEELTGGADWYVNMATPRFEFSGAHELVCDSFQFIGGAAPGPSTWLWAWANISGFGPHTTGLSATVREYGLEHGIAEFTTAEIPFDELPGSPTDPRLVSALFADAVKAVTGHWTSYHPNVGGGTRAVYLLEHEDFRLPEPGLVSVMSVIERGISSLQLVTDQRRALHSYATKRGLEPELNPDETKLRMSGPDFTVVAEFDELRRITAVSATAPSPQDEPVGS